ncbi:MAG: SDR family oxidoreductase [Myxococcota bacterium]|nr:SDR family oxidoreductase [Myxococcota bacterium]
MRVIVTGASRGLGAAIAETLRARGDEVIGASRRGGDGVLAADVGTDAGRRAIVAAASDGPVDALVQAAGVIRYEGVGAIDEASIAEQCATNFVGPMLLAQALVPALRRSRGSIVNVASTLALRPAPLTATYSATKAAMLAWTRVFAAELAPDVRVNAVAPGVVDTEMVRQVRLAPGEAPPSDPTARIEAQLEFLRTLHPLGRLGTPDDVARAVLYLLDASWVTGSVLTVDGGLTAL